jgi:hypothetical protein
LAKTAARSGSPRSRAPQKTAREQMTSSNRDRKAPLIFGHHRTCFGFVFVELAGGPEIAEVTLSPIGTSRLKSMSAPMSAIGATPEMSRTSANPRD